MTIIKFNDCVFIFNGIFKYGKGECDYELDTISFGKKNIFYYEKEDRDKDYNKLLYSILNGNPFQDLELNDINKQKITIDRGCII